MTLPADLWEQVRRRAEHACEFCGASEIDSGGLLTVDHYQPRAAHGTDDLTNLTHCCFRCNGYKGDYWPATPADRPLWNPRQEPAKNHLLLLADGLPHPITPTGSFTIELLHLNRPQLAAFRLHRLQQTNDSHRLDRLESRLKMFEQIQEQQMETMEEYVRLLEEHKSRIELLLREFE